MIAHHVAAMVALEGTAKPTIPHDPTLDGTENASNPERPAKADLLRTPREWPTRLSTGQELGSELALRPREMMTVRREGERVRARGSQRRRSTAARAAIIGDAFRCNEGAKRLAHTGTPRGLWPLDLTVSSCQYGARGWRQHQPTRCARG